VIAGAAATGGLGASAALSSACALGGRSQDAAPAPAKVGGTIEFWQGWGVARTPSLRALLDQFEQAHPGARVVDQEFTTLGAQGADRSKIVASVMAGTVPDSLMVFVDMVDFLVPAKVLTNLGPYMARDKVDPKVFVEGDLKGRTYGGQVLLMPSSSGISQTGVGVFWNKEHFRQAGLDPEQGPRTQSELEQMAVRLTVGRGESLERLGVNPASSYVQWLFNNNGRMYSDDGRKVAFDGPEARDALAWLAQLAQRQGAAGPLFETVGIPARTLFYQGKLSMFLAGDNFPSLMRADAVGRNVDWGVGPLPHNERNSRARLVVPSPSRGGHGYGVMTGAKNSEGAWQLAKFLTTTDAQCAFTKELGRLSPLRRCNEDPELQKRPEWAVFSRMTSSMVPTPFTPADTQATAAFETNAQEAVFGRVSPDTAVRAAAQAAQQALDEGWKQWRG
jgi:multiple sugar transport system substrate-binding protein